MPDIIQINDMFRLKSVHCPATMIGDRVKWVCQRWEPRRLNPRSGRWVTITQKVDHARMLRWLKAYEAPQEALDAFAEVNQGQ